MDNLKQPTRRPHNNYVVGVLGEESRALSFLKVVFPRKLFERIDASTFKRRHDYHVDTELDDHPTDLLFEFQSPGIDTPFYIYLLFEHKSSYKPDALAQSLRYQTRIYETITPRGVIIPLIFYHGDPENWKEKQDFQETFEIPDDFRELIKDRALNFRPFFIQAQDIDLDQVDPLWMKVFFIVLMRIFEIRGDENKFKSLIRDISKIFIAKSPAGVYKQTLSYLSIAGGYERKEVARVIGEEISEEAGEEAMKTIEDEIYEGIKENVERIARKLKLRGDSDSEIMSITGISEAELRKVELVPG